MIKRIQYEISRDPKLLEYLHTHAYWYKYLNRNPETYKDFLKSAKSFYKITPQDKINKIMDNINMLSTILEILK